MRSANFAKLHGELGKFSRRQVLEAIVPSVGKVKNKSLKDKMKTVLTTFRFRQGMQALRKAKKSEADEAAGVPEDQLSAPGPTHEPVRVRVTIQDKAYKLWYGVDGLEVSKDEATMCSKVVFESSLAFIDIPTRLLEPRDGFKPPQPLWHLQNKTKTAKQLALEGCGVADPVRDIAI